MLLPPPRMPFPPPSPSRNRLLAPQMSVPPGSFPCSFLHPTSHGTLQIPHGFYYLGVSPPQETQSVLYFFISFLHPSTWEQRRHPMSAYWAGTSTFDQDGGTKTRILLPPQTTKRSKSDKTNGTRVFKYQTSGHLEEWTLSGRTRYALNCPYLQPREFPSHGTWCYGEGFRDPERPLQPEQSTRDERVKERALQTCSRSPSVLIRVRGNNPWTSNWARNSLSASATVEKACNSQELVPYNSRKLMVLA